MLALEHVLKPVAPGAERELPEIAARGQQQSKAMTLGGVAPPGGLPCRSDSKREIS